MATGGEDIREGATFIPTINLPQVPEMVEDVYFMIDYYQTDDMDFFEVGTIQISRWFKW